MRAGIHACTFPDGKAKFSGIMPTTRLGTPAIVSVRPIASWPPPSLVFHSSWLTITTPSRPGRSSPGSNVRPLSARTPRTEKRFTDAALPVIRDAGPSPVKLNSNPGLTDATSSVRHRCSKYISIAFGCRFVMRSRRSGSWNGSGRIRSPLTMLKIAVVPAMPRASERIATVLKPGFLTKTRSA